MDATQFVGIVEPCRAPDHSHTYDEVGYIVDRRGIRAHRRRVDPAPARILFSSPTRAGALHREHRAGRDADPRRLPSRRAIPRHGPTRTSRSSRRRHSRPAGIRAARARVAGGPRAPRAAESAPRAACDSPRIGFMGPITGDAAFIGKEQLGFAKYAIRNLGGGKIKLIEGDTQLEPGARREGRQDAPREPGRARGRRPGRQPGGARGRAGLHEGRPAAVHLRLGHPRPADERLDPELLPRRPERRRPAADDREVHPPGAEGEGRVRRRRPDGVLAPAGERCAGEAEGRRRQGHAAVGRPEGDRLRGARREGRRRRRRRLPAVADRRERAALRPAAAAARRAGRHLRLGRGSTPATSSSRART